LALLDFKATNFRCLAAAEMEPDEKFNLIYGDNASGKTSVLEAIAYLGRGKSFHGASTTKLVRHGSGDFILFGRAQQGERRRRLGVRNGSSGLEISVDGERGGGGAELARVLPLQVIDPEIHRLVAGGPDERRRYLDWMVFHVEQNYVDTWRRFRRSLKQRNAALKGGASSAELDVWDKQLASFGVAVGEARGRVFEMALPGLRRVAAALLGSDVDFEYRRGWTQEKELLEALQSGRGRDLQMGSTQTGPHRADLLLIYDERQARRLVSRGQQKLLACAMVLAAIVLAQASLDEPLLLLLDDPAAELDETSLDRLMESVAELNCQVIATSLVPRKELFARAPAMFHVEQGGLKRVP
jgi:DNA replication and repair protein RecF